MIEWRCLLFIKKISFELEIKLERLDGKSSPWKLPLENSLCDTSWNFVSKFAIPIVTYSSLVLKSIDILFFFFLIKHVFLISYKIIRPSSSSLIKSTLSSIMLRYYKTDKISIRSLQIRLPFDLVSLINKANVNKN